MIMAPEPLSFTKCRLTEDDVASIVASHRNSEEMLRYVRSLQNLDQLTDINRTLGEIKSGLLSAATGKDHVDQKTFDRVLRNLHWMYGIVVGALLFIVVFLVTGQKLGIVTIAPH